MVDLRDRRAEALAELGLQRLQLLALALQVGVGWEMKLELEETDEGHYSSDFSTCRTS
jgi:hypothetical protein